jgi:hypothetical protein
MIDLENHQNHDRLERIVVRSTLYKPKINRGGLLIVVLLIDHFEKEPRARRTFAVACVCHGSGQRW